MTVNGTEISFMGGEKFTTIVLRNYKLSSTTKPSRIINAIGRCMKVHFYLFRRSFS